MKISPENISFFASKIAESEAKLQQLEREIEEIGQPAAHELKRRLDSLRVEESALERNLAEALGMGEPDAARMEKIEVLLTYIQREQASVKHEADFLHQSSPTSAEFAARAGSRLVDLCLRAMKRVLGDHHPLGMSVFVNHSHETLATQYGLDSTASEKPEVN